MKFSLNDKRIEGIMFAQIDDDDSKRSIKRNENSTKKKSANKNRMKSALMMFRVLRSSVCKSALRVDGKALIVMFAAVLSGRN